MPRDLFIYGVWGLIDGGEARAGRSLRNILPNQAGWDRATNHLGEEGYDLGFGFMSWLYISDRLEMGGLGRSCKGPSGSTWRRGVAFSGWKDLDMSMRLVLNEDIWHLGGGREIGTGVRLVMIIDAVGGNRLGGNRDGGRRLRPPVVGTRRMIGRIKVGGGRGERKGRQVGQLEGFLFSAEGPMYGIRGRLFTVISILRDVCCYGRIVSSGRGRVAHLSTNRRQGFRRLSCLPINSSFPAPMAATVPCLPLFSR